MAAFAIFWSVLAIIVTLVLAHQKGRNLIGWGILAFFIGWIAVIIIAFMKPVRSAKPREVSKSEYINDSNERKKKIREEIEGIKDKQRKLEKEKEEVNESRKQEIDAELKKLDKERNRKMTELNNIE